MSGDPLVVDAENPWPGLLSFTEDARDFFHGREREADELARMVRREPLTVLFGQSGLGKTSLLQAGLFPRLRRDDFLPVYIRLDTTATAPDLVEQIRARVREAIEAEGVDAPAWDAAVTLWEYFHTIDHDFWSRRHHLVVPVLVLDQFEEIFTLGQAEAAAREQTRRLLQALAELVENRMPDAVRETIEADPDRAARYDFARQGARVLVSFREDYLPDFEGLRRLIPSIMHNRLRITRFSLPQALDVVRKGGGHLVDAEVARRIALFVAGVKGEAGGEEDDARREVEPALLSLICHELNVERRRTGAPRITDELLRGAREAILTGFYARAVADVDPRAREFIEDQLLTQGGYRDSHALEDALRVPGVTRETIDTLVGRRLIRLEERFGILRLELTHDVLTGVVRESRDHRVALRAQAEAVARERAQRRRTRIALGVGGAMTLVAVGFAVLAWQAVRDKHRVVKAQSELHLAKALTQIDEGKALAGLASLESALQVDPDNVAAGFRVASLLSHRRFPRVFATGQTGAPVNVTWSMAGDRMLIANGDAVTAFDPPNQRTTLVQDRDNRILALATSPDGSVLATAGERGAKVWIGEPREGERWRPRLLPHDGLVVGVEFDARGRFLATASLDRTARLWFAATGRPVPLEGAPNGANVMPHDKPVYFAVFHPRGDLLLTGSDDGTLRLWKIPEGTPLGPPLRHELAATAAAFSPDGSLAATGSLDGSVSVWDTTTWGRRFAPLLSRGPITSVEFSRDGRHLLTSSVDQSVRLWELSGTEARPVTLSHEGIVAGARFSPSGKRVVTAGWDGTARVWDVATGRQVGESLSHPSAVGAARLLSDERLVMTTTRSAEIQWWRLPADPRAAPLVSLAKTEGVFDTTGRSIVTADAEGTVSWLEGDTGKAVPVARHADGVSTVAASDNGKAIAVADRQQGVTLYARAGDAGWRVVTRLPSASPVSHVAFSPDGVRLATGEVNGSIRLWRSADGRPDGTAIELSGPVTALVFSPDGRFVGAGAASGRATVIDVAAAFPRAEFAAHTGRVNAVTFTRGSSTLATAGEDGSVKLWKAPAWSRAGELKHPAIVWDVDFSADGTRLATACFDGVVRVWSLAGTALGLELRHGNVATTARYSHDGRWIVTASHDGTAVVWDALTGQPVTERLVHDDVVQAAHLSRDGARLLVVTPAATVVWRAQLGLPVTPPRWLAGFVKTARLHLTERGQEPPPADAPWQRGGGAWEAWARDVARVHGMATETTGRR